MSSSGETKQLNARGVRAWSVLRSHRQLQLFRALLIGLLAGLLAVAFQESLWLAEGLRDRFIDWVKFSSPFWWLAVVFTCAAAGGLAGYLVQRFARDASGSGIPHVKAVLIHIRHMDWASLLPVKFFGGVLAIGAGFSLGREGPTVQMGAAVGKALCGLLRVPRKSRSQLIAAGAGAGLAAAFNAPLAGFIFVIEELQREMSPLTYATALIAAVIGDTVTRTICGQLPSFHVSGYPTPSLLALPLFAVLGAVCGVAGAAFNRSLMKSVQIAGALKLSTWQKAALAGVVVALAALFMPAAIGGGHSTAEIILRGESETFIGGQPVLASVIGFLVILFAAKFMLTVVSYASGVPGGIFAPLLVLGAVTGAVVGRIGGIWWPEVANTPAAFAVVGMAAMFAATVRAPLTGVVLVLEMTGNYNQLLALLVASLLAYLVANELRSKPIYESLLEQDLKHIGKHKEHPDEPVMINITVDTGSRLDGRRVRDLGLPKGALLVNVDRAGKQIVPYADLELKPGDNVEVLISGQHPEVIASLQEMSDSLHR